jgi:hypothetical protein
LSVLFIGDRDQERFAEHVQERTDALEGAADLLDLDWTETVTKLSLGRTRSAKVGLTTGGRLLSLGGRL